MLTYAFYIVASKSKGIEADKLVKIIELVSKYAGVQGMIGGQVVDIESEGKIVDLPTLQYIHTHKTGMMIRLPIEAGAVLAGVEGSKKEALIRYADLIGLAFQIKDDLLDIEGTFEDIGKPVGSDLKLEKSTYPAIFGIEKTKVMLDEKISELINHKGPMICEVFTGREQLLIPRVASKKEDDGKIISMPYDDMFPFLSREEYEYNKLKAKECIKN